MNIIHKASEYGEVIAGVLSDSAMLKYNRFPIASFEERIKMLEEIPEVSRVVIQNNVMYDETIAELKPDYVIHGDNWHDGSQSLIRQNVIDVLCQQFQRGGVDGKLIEVPYTYNDNVKKLMNVS